MVRIAVDCTELWKRSAIRSRVRGEGEFIIFVTTNYRLSASQLKGFIECLEDFDH
jgi:hypothetical protein